MNNNQFGRSILTNSFLARIVQMRRYFLTMCTKPLHKEKNIKQMSCSNQEKGRSMVEMLGVLAIIGVLSVGAIAGYQKAMFKYKLNKQAQQLNQVINTVAMHYKDFLSFDTYTHITSHFIKLGDIPQEMIKKNNNNYIRDVFNTAISITATVGPSVDITLNLSLEENDVSSLEICKNVINVAQQNSQSISYISSVSNKEEGGHNSKIFCGDARCTKDTTCMKNLSLDDIYELCTYHTGKENQHFKISFQ